MTSRASRPAWKLAITAVAVFAATVAPSATQSAEGAPCNGSRWVVRTFSVETSWNKKSYSGGEKAKVQIAVTRPGPEDPAGMGLPIPAPPLLPAEDVTVSTTLMAKWPFPWARAVTGADGKATLKLKIPNGWSGRIPASTMALRLYNEGGPACSDIEEQGEQYDFVNVKS